MISGPSVLQRGLLFEVNRDDLPTAFKDGKVKSGCSAKVEPYKTRSIKKLVRWLSWEPPGGCKAVSSEMTGDKGSKG